MLRWKSLFLLLIVFVAWVPLYACAHVTPDRFQNLVEIEILSESGEAFPVYPVNYGSATEYRSYLEAIKNQNYEILIRNKTGNRVGLVIAVDGRNIISGQKSYLTPNESMCILNPYETQNYEGWRTSEHAVHRFFFTDSDQSYAHAFGDDTAMGVIAVAVYEEKQTFYTREKERQYKDKAARAPAPTAESKSADAAEAAGTGFGEETSSYAYQVEFNPERTAATKYFYKYEWRQTLCEEKVIRCVWPDNRFWPRDQGKLGFAPYPPYHK